MINNKQVNLWRGDEVPPTIYHVWIYKNVEIRLYNGEEWITFVNSFELTQEVLKLQNDVNLLNKDVEVLNKAKVNNKLIKDNPILSGIDLLLTKNGNIINSSDNLTDSIVKIDSVLKTLIIE